MTVRRAAVAALVVGVLLSGCAGDPEPRFAEPSDPASSPTESASSEEPERQSAEEFIREWVALDTEMQNTGETDEYLAVSSRCPACRDFADRVTKVYDRGGHIRTKGWVVKSIGHLGRNRYRLVVRSLPTTVVEKSGAPEQRFEGGQAAYELVTRRVGDGWQVFDWYEVAT